MHIRRRATMLVAVALAASMSLAACQRQISPNVYTGSAVGEARQTYTGTIQQASVIQVQENELLQQNTMGMLIGGGIGGAAASRIGQGWGKAAAVAGGALLGATAGALAQKELQKQQAMEYIVRTDTGQLLTIVQGMQPQLSPGERVYVQVSTQGRARVIPAAG